MSDVLTIRNQQPKLEYIVVMQLYCAFPTPMLTSYFMSGITHSCVSTVISVDRNGAVESTREKVENLVSFAFSICYMIKNL